MRTFLTKTTYMLMALMATILLSCGADDAIPEKDTNPETKPEPPVESTTYSKAQAIYSGDDMEPGVGD